MSDAVLIVDKLSVQYEERDLLQDISFELLEGEILCLLGPSGSGKTTLLRIIAGLETAAAGRVIFGGRDMAVIPPHQRNFGMMFQEYALFPHKNVSQNIAFGLEMQKMGSTDIEARVDEMLELVGLQQYGQSRIDELSGGERQRVALARSLAPKPKLLLLDEPLGSLDRALRDRLAGEIREILKQLRVTAIFVTHDQTEAFGIADKIAILQDAVLQQFDRPENIYRRPASTTVANFLGFKNILSGSISEDGIFTCEIASFPLTEIMHPAPLPGGQLSLLILPEGASVEKRRESSQLQLSGKVAAKTFFGSFYRLVVEIGTSDFTFDVPNYPEPQGSGREITIFVSSHSIVPIAT